MNLHCTEARTDLRHLPPVLPDATEFRPTRAIATGTMYLMLVSVEDTTPLLLEPTESAETGIVVTGSFAVGFKPQGARTALFRAPSDFALLPKIKQIPKSDTQKEKNRRAITLLQSWLSVDEQQDAEHRETLEYLIKTLDEDRPSKRKLFP